MKKAPPKKPNSPPCPHLTYFITVLVVGALNQWTKPRNVIEKQQINQSVLYTNGHGLMGTVLMIMACMCLVTHKKGYNFVVRKCKIRFNTMPKSSAKFRAHSLRLGQMDGRPFLSSIVKLLLQGMVLKDLLVIL